MTFIFWGIIYEADPDALACNDTRCEVGGKQDILFRHLSKSLRSHDVRYVHKAWAFTCVRAFIRCRHFKFTLHLLAQIMNTQDPSRPPGDIQIHLLPQWPRILSPRVYQIAQASLGTFLPLTLMTHIYKDLTMRTVWQISLPQYKCLYPWVLSFTPPSQYPSLPKN